MALGLDLNNPGNIERGDPWQGLAAQQLHHRFATFEAPEWGLRAIARTLITYYDNRVAKDGSKIDTVREIVERWAPAEDGNPVNSYTHALTKRLEEAHKAAGTEAYTDGKKRINVYDPVTMRALVEGIVLFENGTNPYSKETITNALTLAGVVTPKATVAKDATVIAASAAATTSTAAVVLDTVSPAMDTMKGLLPYVDSIGVALAVATVVFTVLAVWVKIQERGKQL